MIKIFFDLVNFEEFYKVYVKIKYISFDIVFDGMSILFYFGVIKFYEEKGIMVLDKFKL